MERMAKWRRHSLEFKRQVVERMKSCPNITELARELQLERKLLYIWKGQLEGRPEPRHANLGLTTEARRETQLREEITKLKLSLADRTLENDFFKHALLKVREGRQPNTPPGAAASTTPSARGSKSKAR